MPYNSGGKGLHFYGVREAVSGSRIVTTAVRSDNASSTTGVELLVAMAAALGSRCVVPQCRGALSRSEEDALWQQVFAAWEQPGLFASELRAAFRSLRKSI